MGGDAATVVRVMLSHEASKVFSDCMLAVPFAEVGL